MTPEYEDLNTETDPKDFSFPENLWQKTHAVKERLRNDPFFEEGDGAENVDAKFQGRPLIGRDTRIHGGVYMGASAREAIVVDEKYGELEPIYQELLSRRDKEIERGGKFKEGVLTEVWRLTKEKLPYSAKAVEEVAKKLGVGEDAKVRLDRYIKEGGGVCRHQALLGAYLLEKLADEGKVEGHVSVDRNRVPGVGGHAWIRYTNSSGKVYIIDPAQDYIGALDAVEKGNRWFYERPEDFKPE